MNLFGVCFKQTIFRQRLRNVQDVDVFGRRDVVNRLAKDRETLRAIAMASNASVNTAVRRGWWHGNDQPVDVCKRLQRGDVRFHNVGGTGPKRFDSVVLESTFPNVDLSKKKNAHAVQPFGQQCLHDSWALPDRPHECGANVHDVNRFPVDAHMSKTGTMGVANEEAIRVLCWKHVPFFGPKTRPEFCVVLHGVVVYLTTHNY